MAQDQSGGESVAQAAVSQAAEIADRALTSDKLGETVESMAEAGIFDLKVEF